ncbi:preprotein translocase subunit SecY [Candidatus Peregrinibacteria bacterium]|nr:MAG: preprotein translocase subunit SecY [Candidatus Peregrinibacteria bacterium]
MEYLIRIWNSPDLRKRILFTLFIILVFRIAAHITVPGVNPESIKSLFEGGSAFAVLAAITGGSLKNFSIVMMGLSPYINASIIIQLMTVVFPSLEQLTKEGEQGQRRITSMTRWLTLPLALAQSYGMIVLISRGVPGSGEFINVSDPLQILPAMMTITAGTIFLVWLGEMISEKGIGNGISLLIFTGIISAMPGIVFRIISQAGDGFTDKILPFILFIAVSAFLLIVMVIVMSAQRPIQIINASRNTTGERSSLPIRFLQAGMIPIIFAISLVTFPSILAQLFANADSSWLQSAAGWWTQHFNQQRPTKEYLILYFTLIVLFSYFYVSITFRTEQVAENIQKRGGFIPGIRPGRETSEHLAFVSNRMNLWGGSFLGGIALVPLLFTMLTPLSSSDLIISGSGLIIVVGVVLELIRQINAQLVTHNYDKLT